MDNYIRIDSCQYCGKTEVKKWFYHEGMTFCSENHAIFDVFEKDRWSRRNIVIEYILKEQKAK